MRFSRATVRSASALEPLSVLGFLRWRHAGDVCRVRGGGEIVTVQRRHATVLSPDNYSSRAPTPFFRHVHRRPCPVCDADEAPQPRECGASAHHVSSSPGAVREATPDDYAMAHKFNEFTAAQLKMPPVIGADFVDGAHGPGAPLSAPPSQRPFRESKSSGTLNSAADAVSESKLLVVPAWVPDPEGRCVTTAGMRGQALASWGALTRSSGATIDANDVSSAHRSSSNKSEEDLATAAAEALAMGRFRAARTSEDLADSDYDLTEEYLDKVRRSAEGDARAAARPTSLAETRDAPVAADEESAGKKQAAFARTLRDADDILTALGVPFFLCCGTALGVVREQRFIPHDADIDIGVFFEDLGSEPSDTLCRVLAAFGQAALVGRSSEAAFVCIDCVGEVGFGMELRFRHSQTGVLLDLNVYYTDQDPRTHEPFVWCATHYEESASRKHGMYRYRHAPFVPLPVRFCGREFRVPPVAYLEEYFGADWRTPKCYSYREGLAGEYKNLIAE